jgi:hypothetical protein
MGPQMRQMLDALCVALSLTLVALGGSDLIVRFWLGTLSVRGPSTIMGPIWDTIFVSHVVIAVVMCEE